ncbi:hypothetical protein ATZ33_16085 [Enterococcus silesiacus]|uniref:M protein trans-acting positive regulator n=1 Tax=Enterococcus silesiacus TaxID=332949 RepID=A0A0S3KEV8_9ENTE|nr:helix-turn-helix domain-containing protein [Enterococcus silesiacus]ALS02839.1 hypothetical protein ATZ33_16085 [Enterococcus silesiacus]OJG85814.1 M protein trans-acting positive regulator [Enterococcus silesiacus]
MKQFLNKEYQYRLAILNYLEIQPLQNASFKQLSNELMLSTYVIKKEVGQLLEDFDFYQISDLKIVIENKTVYFYTTGQDSLLTLQWYYLKESKLFLLLDALFKEEHFSFEDFSTHHYLSLSATYLLKSELDELLDLYDISINSNLEFSGVETAIRIFLFDVYFFSFNSLEFPFSTEILNLSENLLKKIGLLHSMNFPDSQKIKLKFFLAIIFQRLYGGHTISTEEPTEEEASLRITSVKEWFTVYTNLTSEEISREVTFIYSFLIAEQMIAIYEPKVVRSHIKNFCPDAFRLTAHFIKELKKEFDVTEESSYYSSLRDGLLQVHYRYLRFTHINASYSFESDFVFFKENYPDFFLFIDSFMKKRKLHTDSASTLQYDYLFLLIQHMPTTIISTPVYVCVDFLYGKAYNEFIIENIQSFKFLNIVIENTISEKTDLYLSDIKLNNLPCAFIIWKKPPLASDWEHFGNIVVEMKERKTVLNEQKQSKKDYSHILPSP